MQEFVQQMVLGSAVVQAFTVLVIGCSAHVLELLELVLAQVQQSSD